MSAPRVQRRAGVVWRRSLDAVHFGVHASDDRAAPATVHSMGGSGPLVWELLTEPHSVDEMVDALVPAADPERARAATELERLVDELIGLGVVERVE